MDELHRRLLEVGFAAGDDLGLMLAGGYAMCAHELVDRPSQDIDFATATALPLTVVVARLSDAYLAAGFAVQVIETTPRMARMLVTDGAVSCEVDLLKEALRPPARLNIGPVLAFEDAVGLKVRALHDRAAHRDFIDVRAANGQLGWVELEKLCACHTVGFSLEELADRLGGIEERDTRTFLSYGLDASAVNELRDWALRWETDIRNRLASGETGPTGVLDSEWETYLDRL
ncbi:nucleotidyl transferase AbiEii/AbiGii toxin family protein [Micromonospora soli]|uniref:nucleotidyl transferase AbiEii/AbiGii toxin family protein n=1 Tax=Micromonospora sp. NBRC 110009 TaxID=3061627 RepID=UPI00267404B6|nr:nucleotidyl transferase AbiEii/AbiGii toxin family protein [Micromonospora sp. NBRC 110009]WKU00125.1 nucleotidyl transferase AbiEii/AbiGii toxin family protein [Micromonospora sp. NBRC 110009]